MINEILYIGSSKLGKDYLSENHRNWVEKGYDWTFFRENLIKNHKDSGEFEWLVKPDLRTLREVEELEEKLINKHTPKYNRDYKPVQSSLSRGRYSKPDAVKKRYRGVYCFKDVV